MKPNLHYTIDLFDPKVTLSDAGEMCTWIQGFPLGEWTHPVYGKIKMTGARVANFVKNFYDKVRGTDLDIDYEHKAVETKAAGWIKDVRDDGAAGLSLLVEWTPTAKRALADKEFRYFSPEFVDSWKRPSDGKVFQDVLFGGALTNRPFLKEIQPINLSDFGLEPEGDDVEELLKALAEALGLKELSDDSTKAQTAIVDAIQSLSEKAKTPPAPKTEDDDKLKKLSESDPLIAQLLSDREVDRKRLNLLEASNKLSEVTRKLSDVNTPKSALPPAFADVMRDVLVKLSDKDNSTVIEALKQLNETGLVTLGELGGKNSKERQQSDKGDAIKSFNDGVAKIVKEDKVSYREATERFSDAEPALWAAYNEAQLQKVD